MGTQQILLIVLSVVIVGIAIAVGISMFQQQAENSNRQAVIGDLQNFGAQAMSYYRTPTTMAGGGSSFGADLAAAKAGVGSYMGFAAAGTLSNDNGTYTLTYTSGTVIGIEGLGNEVGKDGATKTKATLTITATAASPLGTVINN